MAVRDISGGRNTPSWTHGLTAEKDDNHEPVNLDGSNSTLGNKFSHSLSPLQRMNAVDKEDEEESENIMKCMPLLLNNWLDYDLKFVI